MDHKTYKIFDADDFERVTRGIKVAQCMRTDSSAGPMLDSETVLGKLDELSVSDKLYCSYCACSFDSQQQQRQHYKLDWHRYNLKQSLGDRRAVTEENFAQLADHDDVSSISGSESDNEEEDEEEDESDRDPSALKPRVVDSVESSSSSSDENDAARKTARKDNAIRLMASRHTKVFFENQDGKIISVHRCLLHGKKTPLEKDEEFVATALKCVERTKWAIFMLGGGHFAAAIFDGREVVQHKTFHSYTVRKGQGGTQSSRDNRSGGSHPKSAGASLRRYNEAALIQHVQDITASWSDDLDACDLVFYRASGGNMAVLFGGRNPPLAKKDPRLRTIPFPTRRATFSEVKRVHDVLATLESYGMAEAYQSSFPQSPRKKLLPKSADLETSTNPDAPVSTAQSNEPILVENNSDSSPQVRSPRQRPDRAKSRETVQRSLPSIVKKLAEDSSESDGDSDEGDHVNTSSMSHEYVTMNFARDLCEYEDTVPQGAKNKKRKKPRVRKAKGKEEEVKPVILKLSNRLMSACQKGDITVLKSIVSSVNLNNSSNQHSDVCKGDNINISEICVPGMSKEITEDSKDITKELSKEGSKEEVKDVGDQRRKTEKVGVVSSEDLLTCLNRPIDGNDNTLLHLASSENQMDIVRYLMEIGSNPSVRNKKGQPPYVVATTKEMRNLFRRFLAEFPDKFDYTKSLIPGGLTDEMEQEQAEKRRALKKAKREREKEKKKEDEAKKQEAQEKERFLKLTDREKRALAAERRMLSSATTAGVAAPIVARCFLCAVDMTGKVPFEYDIHRFCSITCLKAHRMSRTSTL